MATQITYGQPIDCDYTWIQPSQVDDFGGSVRHAGNKMRRTLDAYEAVTGGDPTVFAGRAATAIQELARAFTEEANETQGNIRALATHIDNYANAMRAHKRSLEELFAMGKSFDLPMSTHHIHPPVGMTATTHAEQQKLQNAWDNYGTCFETKRTIVEAHNEALRELRRGIFECTGLRPSDVAKKRDEKPKNNPKKRLTAEQRERLERREEVRRERREEFRKTRREAVTQTKEYLDAKQAVRDARSALVTSERRALDATEELQRLIREGAGTEQIQRQSAALDQAQSEVEERRAMVTRSQEVVAQELKESNQANKDFRDLQREREQGGSRSGVERDSGSQRTQTPPRVSAR